MMKSDSNIGCKLNNPGMNLERERERASGSRSNESGRELVLVQEMNGRKPEGGGEREPIQLCHTHKGSRSNICKGPLGAFTKDEEEHRGQIHQDSSAGSSTLLTPHCPGS